MESKTNQRNVPAFLQSRGHNVNSKPQHDKENHGHYQNMINKNRNYREIANKNFFKNDLSSIDFSSLNNSVNQNNNKNL